MSAPRLAWIAVLVPACFHPSYDRPACSASGECPAGLTCSAQQICEPPTLDARTDPDAASPDGPVIGAPTCWARWAAHQLVLTAPARIDGLSTAASERDPWISADNKRMYFDRDPGGLGLSDIYLASRSAAGAAWEAPQLQVNLNTAEQEARPAFTEDELTVALASNRTASRFALVGTTRPPGGSFGTPSGAGFEMLNAAEGVASESFDPFFTDEGKTIYFAPDPSSSERQHIWSATRPAIGQPFGAPSRVRGINGDLVTVADADPALSLDELVIVFSSTRPGGLGVGDLYYATRASRDADFGAPRAIPNVNSNSGDNDPMLSRDGCDVYFASDRGGNFDLYLSHLTE